MEFKYNKAGKLWTKEEDQQLNKLYTEDMLDIMEISKIYLKNPNGLLNKLITKRRYAKNQNINQKLLKQPLQQNKKNTIAKPINKFTLNKIMNKANAEIHELQELFKILNNYTNLIIAVCEFCDK